MKTSILSLSALGAALLFSSLAPVASAQMKMAGKTAILPALGPVNASGPSGSSGFFITSVTTAVSTTGLPCYNCGPANSVALPYPQRLLQAGVNYDVIAQFQSVEYFGVPSVTATLTQGGVVIGGGTVEFSSPFKPGYVGYAYFTGVTPNTTGPVSISVQTFDASTGVLTAQAIGAFSIY